MKRIVAPAVSLLVLSLSMAAFASTGIRSVGVRLIFPLTGIPLYLGGEVVTEAAFGDLFRSLSSSRLTAARCSSAAPMSHWRVTQTRRPHSCGFRPDWRTSIRPGSSRHSSSVPVRRYGSTRRTRSSSR